MSWRRTPGRSTPAPLRVTGKARRPCPCVRLRGLPDQTCSKGSSGFSDMLGVLVRPVGGCGCCVLRGERYMGVDCMYGLSVNSVTRCSVNNCSREEPASHSPVLLLRQCPWVCDARYTGACLGRPYLRACGCAVKGRCCSSSGTVPVSVGLKSKLSLNSRESGSVRARGGMAT